MNKAEITISAPGQGKMLNILGASVQVKSSGRDDQMFFADHPVPVGYHVPLHVHQDEDELFYLLSGELTLYSETGARKADAGSFIHLPRGVAHGFANTSGAPAHMLVITTPGGALQGLFHGLDEVTRQPEPLTGDNVAAICAANRIDMQ